MANAKSYVLLTWQDATGQTIDVTFDVVSADTYEAVMAITAHPVEKGAPIVDHARPEPVKLSLEAFVSNTPLPSNIAVDDTAWDWGAVSLTYPSDQRPALGPTKLEYPPSPGPSISLFGAMSAIDKALGGGLPDHVDPTPRAAVQLPQTANAFRANGPMPDRARAVFEKLEAARIGRSLVKVSTRFHDIDNMLISSVAIDRNEESAGGLPFQVELQQVRIVSSQVVNHARPSQPRAAPEVDKGSQVPDSLPLGAAKAFGAALSSVFGK